MAGGPDSIRVVGLDALRRDLKKVDAELPGELAKLNKDAADIVVVEAQHRAPRGVHQGGGKWAPIAPSIAARQQARRAAISIGGAKSPHAVVTEFGGTIPRKGADKTLVRLAQQRHASFARVGITRRTQVKQRAYLYPALSAKRDEVMRVYEDGIEQLFSRISN